MKLAMVMFAILLLITSCEGSTQYGECVGVADDERPDLLYKVSVRNVVVAFIFSESMLIPFVVVLWDLKCPYDKIEAKTQS